MLRASPFTLLTAVPVAWLPDFVMAGVVSFRSLPRRPAPFYKNLLISFRLPREQLAVGDSQLKEDFFGKTKEDFLGEKNTFLIIVLLYAR